MLSSSLQYYTDDSKNSQSIYYNIDIVNGRTTSTGNQNDPIASFSETRDVPIVSDASQYKMSIIRFTMNGIKDLPLFIPTIEEGQPNPNKTVYKISMDLNVNGTLLTDTETVMYSPEKPSLSVSNPVHTVQDVSDEYYYVHTYQHFLNLVNFTLSQVMSNLNTQAVALDPTFTNIEDPVIIFNSSTNCFDLYIPDVPNLKLYFNTNMYNLFSNYPSIRNNEDDVKAYEIVPINPLKVNSVELNGSDYIEVKQEAPSIGTFWSPISAIVFTSNMLPIVSEGVAPTIVYGSSNNAQPVNSISNFEPIITDIALTLDNAYEYKQFLSYIPTSQYRYVSLTNSQQAIKSINVNVYWKSRLTGQLIPLRMSNLSNISIKFLFEKK